MEAEGSLSVGDNSPLVPILSQMNPFSTLPYCFFKIRFSIFPQSTIIFPSDLFPSVFLPKLCMHFCPMPVTCPAHLFHLDLIVLLIFGEEYKLWSTQLWYFLQSPATSFVLGLNILFNLVFWNTAEALPVMWKTKFHTHIQVETIL
jgi:hypothetical protein